MRGLKKDHAMTAYLVDATPTDLTGPGPPYTTLRDSTLLEALRDHLQ